MIMENVGKINILSISMSAIIKYPSTAFLYVADYFTGNEITRRNNIFESNKNGGATDLLTAVKLPEGIEKIRLGILFSKNESYSGHQM